VWCLRVERLQPVFGLEQPIDRTGGPDGLADSLDIEVVVLRRGDRQEGAGGDGRHEFGEVERHLANVVRKLGRDAGHVAGPGPTGEVIARECAEPATGDHRLEPGFEQGGEDRIVSSQRMADHRDAPGIDLGKLLQQVDRAHVVPDRLHGAAGIFGMSGEVPGVLSK